MKKNLLYGITVLLCTLMSVSQAKADDYADYLTAANGFTEVTTVDGLKSGSNYYYVFQSVEDPTLVLANGRHAAKPDWASDGSWTPHYTNFAGMPLTDLNMYYQLEYGSYTNVEGETTYTGSGFGMKSAVNTSNFFQTHGNAGYMWVNTFTDAQVDVWDAFTPAYANGSWTFYVNRFDGEDYWFNDGGTSNYLGPWDEGQFTNSMAIAANKSAANAGHFKVWRISKTDYATLKNNLLTKALYSATSSNPVNATYRITNASFETGDLTGWEPGGNSDYPANTEIDAKPSVTSNGEGQYTFNTYQWWAESLTIEQTASVPSGIYDVSAIVATWENRTVSLTVGNQTVTENGLGDMTGIPVSIQNITVGTDNSLFIHGESTAQWWNSGHEGETQTFFKLDNIQLICKGIYLAGLAEALPNNNTTNLVPGQWYYYEAAELGNYQLTGDLTNMVYSQNGTQIVGEGLSYSQVQSRLTFNAGRVYFMTTASNAKLQVTPLNGAGATTDFSVCSLNVDGLPESILFVTLNTDGPQAAGTRLISQYLAQNGYDLIGVQEDFNFDDELKSSLGNYGSGTHRGKVTGLSNNTDGLNFFWNTAKGRSASGETYTAYNHTESGDGNQYIKKGWRYYEVTLSDGMKIDLYMTHMDAGDVTSSRNIQWTELANAVIANTNTKRPKIILGDFNSRFTREAIIDNFFTPVEATGNYTVSDAWVEKTRSGNYPSIGPDAAGEVVDKIIYLNPTATGSVQLTLNSYVRDSENYTYEAIGSNAGTGPLGDHAPVVAYFTAHEPAVTITPADDRWVWKGETRATTDQKWYLYNVQYGINSKQGFLSRESNPRLESNPNAAGVYPFKFSAASGNATLTSDSYKVIMSRSGFISYTYSASLATSGTATSLVITTATAAVAGTLGTAYHFNWSSYTRYFGASSTTALAAQTSTSASNAWALISTDQVAMYNRFVLASQKATYYVSYLPIDDDVKSQMLTLLEKTGVYWTDGTTEQLEALNTQVETWFDDEMTGKITSTNQTISSLPEGFYKVKANVTSSNKQTVTLKMGNWSQELPMTGSTQVAVELPLYYHSGDGSVDFTATATGTSTFANFQLFRYDNYYDETIGTTGYASTAIRYNTDVPAGMEVYYVDRINPGANRNSIHLEKYTGNMLQAGEGVILYKEGLTAAKQFRFYRTNDAVDAITGNQLKGAVNRIEQAQKESGTYYVLSRKSIDNEPTIGFFKLADQTAVPAHKAYLLVTGSSSVKGYVFSFDEEEDVTPTAIQQLENDTEATVTGIYSLNGARQQSLQRGMNIVRMSDGSVKKILVK